MAETEKAGPSQAGPDTLPARRDVARSPLSRDAVAAEVSAPLFNDPQRASAARRYGWPADALEACRAADARHPGYMFWYHGPGGWLREGVGFTATRTDAVTGDYLYAPTMAKLEAKIAAPQGARRSKRA